MTLILTAPRTVLLPGLIDLLRAVLCGARRPRKLDLAALPDTLRADIGLPPLGENRTAILPPAGYQHF